MRLYAEADAMINPTTVDIYAQLSDGGAGLRNSRHIHTNVGGVRLLSRIRRPACWYRPMTREKLAQRYCA